MFTLAVENEVEVPVKLTLKSKGVAKLFSFTLEATRLAQTEINERLENKESLIKDFLIEVVHGWKGQRLVLNERGEPADFGAEAFEAMLNVAGVATVCFNAYFQECGAKAKN